MKEFLNELVNRWHEEGYGCFIIQLEDEGEQGTSRCYATVPAKLIISTLGTTACTLGSMPPCWEGPEDGYMVIKGEGGTEEMVERIMRDVPGEVAIVAGFTDEYRSVFVKGSISMACYLACRTIWTINRTQEIEQQQRQQDDEPPNPFGNPSMN
jgi:hypothetical protein